VPDKLSPADAEAKSHGGVFLTAAIAFFIAEIGDKTQIATVALAARYQDAVAVVAGTTIGMMLANAPVLWFGDRLATRLPLRAIRYGAAALFALLAIVTAADALGL
jgi:putative Ca2+/H+ antiporter (TMEM165/GDT1 family)